MRPRPGGAAGSPTPGSPAPGSPGADPVRWRAAGSGGLEGRFLALLRRRPGLVPPGSRVLVAFSGGPDSTALLALLASVRAELGLELAAAHLDHGLRPSSADEARLSAERAKALSVPCEVERAPEGLRPRQAEMRAARYTFLGRIAAELGADRIATGHQADDQAETILFHLLRGSGLRGVGGIPVRRGRIVRPLLGFRRSELVDWLESRDLAWLEDPSNLDPRWARGRIRTRILPALEAAAGPGVGDALRTLGRAARAADRALEAKATDAIRASLLGAEPGGAAAAGEVLLDRAALLREPPEIRARVLRRLARAAGAEPGRGGTRAGMEFISRGRSGSAVDLGGGLRLAREFDRLALRSAGDAPLAAPQGELSIGGPDVGEGVLSLEGRTLRVSWGRRRATAPASSLRLALPVQPGLFPLRLRSWRPGDRIRLAGGTRKLKRLFGDRRVPRSRRGSIPVLVDADGRVLWVAGVAVDRELEAADGERAAAEPFVVELSE